MIKKFLIAFILSFLFGLLFWRAVFIESAWQSERIENQACALENEC